MEQTEREKPGNSSSAGTGNMTSNKKKGGKKSQKKAATKTRQTQNALQPADTSAASLNVAIGGGNAGSSPSSTPAHSSIKPLNKKKSGAVSYALLVQEEQRRY